MNEVTRSGNSFVGYDYKEVTTDQEKTSMYIDGYMNFGWVLDEKVKPSNYMSKSQMGKVTIKLKRDRKILNKTELTRLQRHFEACMSEIATMEKSKTSFATMYALIIAIIGTAFMAGSVFAVSNDSPMILLCIILAIPAFIGWLLPPFVYKEMVRKKTKKIEPLIEQKYDEIHEICGKGNKLLTK
ncbi:hypothetical protein [Paenibacillus donghaensis]|uniref:Uncharacterized protein n=1 Tax=Paenibacillus donghaensis TaxID=414771 RepID=A0A2Z2KQ23_9BACL|nr:hypothetical protein [Paenibacillus donghaensis]ASA23452.1 hypothetical protein B9T62_23175 [Paenibacillus donghaensis]